MKLIITEGQAEMLLDALNMAYNEDFGTHDPYNRAITRLSNRIERLLGRNPSSWSEANKVAQDMKKLGQVEWAKKYGVYAGPAGK